MQAGRFVLPCVLGRSGITVLKHEGDGATPRAAMAILRGHVRGERLWRSPLFAGLIPTRPCDGWCDEPANPNYNRPITLPFKPSHETMQRKDRLYDVVLVLDWNVSRRARNRGSAIFLHLTSPDNRPTQGCVAVSPPDMQKLLRAGAIGRTLRVV